MQWIGLLDCNNFFVSCERLFRPDLVGKPVVVLSSNDGCVVARSQEVKDINVPMGVPYFQVKDILKKAETTVFSSHFALYRDISRRVFSVMREELEHVQQYSVDEAFFLLEELSEERILRLKRTVEQKVGIPISIGVAATKTQAKYANALAKKSTGTRILSLDDWFSQVETVPLQNIWGVGGRLEMQYKKHGLLTVGQLLACDRERISRLFGVAGARLYDELSGKSVYRLESVHEPQKSIMNSRSFKDATTDYGVVADAVAYHVRHAMADLRAMGMKTKGITVSIRPSRHGDYVLRGGSLEAILPVATDDTFAVLQVAENLTQQLFEAGVPYKKAGVVLSGFVPKDSGQQTLFPAGAALEQKSQPLMAVLDAINHKAGKETLLLGSRLRTSEWQTRVDARSPAYTTRWSDIATVRA